MKIKKIGLYKPEIGLFFFFNTLPSCDLTMTNFFGSGKIQIQFARQ